ncbi:hypothetical protein EIP91_007788 [Steccherinum ochraceum]|uniref:DNA polymerase epsilon subunit D n=1 Tax=Steccherinum ochraceum TaxID=92696 RepID=A0A4R0RHT6_9APHY|nr:hypothetical protein EIP91_007788 [Steccherinum ochraceum]
MARNQPATASVTTPAQTQQDIASDGIESYELPKSLVTRIARSAFPDNVKLQKEAMLALLKGSTVFVNYIAATAHDVAASKQHKSVSASDVLKALELTQFGDMVDKLQDELQAYRDLQKTDKPKRSGPKAKPKDADSASASNAKGKQKAAIVIPTARTESSQAPPPSSDPEDGDETEDDVRLIRAPNEDVDDDAPEQDEEDEDEEVDEEEEEVDDDDDVEDGEQMVVESGGLSQEEKVLEGRTLEHQDQDTEMDT